MSITRSENSIAIFEPIKTIFLNVAIATVLY